MKLPNNRILAIDDDLQLLESYQEILSPVMDSPDPLTIFETDAFSEEEEESQASFHLTTAQQGEIGVEHVRAASSKKKPFAAAFIDMRMPPGIHGLETARRIRALDDHIYIIVVTAYSDHDMDDFQEAVQHDLLLVRKPFVGQEIFQLARNACIHWQRDNLLRQHQTRLKEMVALRTRHVSETNAYLRGLLRAYLLKGWRQTSTESTESTESKERHETFQQMLLSETTGMIMIDENDLIRNTTPLLNNFLGILKKICWDNR